jgi:hypothetical protein
MNIFAALSPQKGKNSYFAAWRANHFYRRTEGSGRELTIIWKSCRCILSISRPLVLHYWQIKLPRNRFSDISWSTAQNCSVLCTSREELKIFFCVLYHSVLWQFHWIFVSGHAWSLVYYPTKVRVIDFLDICACGLGTNGLTLVMVEGRGGDGWVSCGITCYWSDTELTI